MDGWFLSDIIQCQGFTICSHVDDMENWATCSWSLQIFLFLFKFSASGGVISWIMSSFNIYWSWIPSTYECDFILFISLNSYFFFFLAIVSVQMYLANEVIGVAPTPWKDRDTGRMPCNARNKNWSDAAANQDMPRTFHQLFHLKPGRSKKGFPYRFQRQHDPLAPQFFTFTSELWDRTFLL